MTEIAKSNAQRLANRGQDLPLPTDAWLRDVHRVTEQLAAQWVHVLGHPRWRLLQPGPPGLAWVVILIHSRFVDPQASAMASADAQAGHLSLLGARAGDLALMAPAGDPGFWNNADLLLATRSMTEDRVRLRLSWLEWQLCEDVRLRLTASGSWFEPVLLRFQAIHRNLLTQLMERATLSRAQGAESMRQLSARERRLVRNARHFVFAGLDPRALRSLRRAGAHLDAATYNFLVTGGAARSRREAALEAAPGLMVATLQPGALSDLPEREQLVDSIDRGEEPLQSLASHYDTSLETIECIARVPVRRVAIESTWHAASVVKMLDLLPDELRPQTRPDWRAFVAGATTLNAMAAVLEEPTDGENRTFRDGGLRTFLCQAGRVGWAGTAVRNPAVFPSGPRVILDPFFRLPACAEALRLTEEQLKGVFSEASAEELVTWASAWEPVILDLDATYFRLIAEGCAQDDVAWPPLSSIVELRGLQIVPVFRAEHLCHEGRSRGYSVANELPLFLFSGQHWVWITDADGNRLSILELKLRPDDTGALCLQPGYHMAGTENRMDVPEHYRQVAGCYLDLMHVLPRANLRVLESARNRRVAERARFDAAQAAAEQECLRLALARTVPARLWNQIQNLRCELLDR